MPTEREQISDGNDQGNSNSVTKQVGTLILDPDVLFALQNLKEIGKGMRLNTAAAQNGDKSTSASRSAFTPFNIKREPDDQKQPSFGNLPTFSSPQQRISRGLTSPPGPGRVFGAFKRHSVDTFSGQSGKKKKPNTTPGRNSMSSPAATPGRMFENVEGNLVLAECKCKLADTGDMFLRKKKTTAANASVLFQSIKERGKEVVVFDDGPQSFYKIMTYYARGLEMVPEDMRFRTLKEQLFDFVMENMKYTQVRELIFNFRFL